MIPAQLTAFSEKDFEILDRKILHAGFFRYVQYQLRHRLFKGGWTPVLTRDLIERTCAVGILPYDPASDKVVLISQFRPGALKHESTTHDKIPHHPWLIEIVAGLIDKVEKPDEVAIREAQEEAGCHVLELYPISDYFVSPGGSNEYIHLYCGCINASGVQNTYGLVEEGEDIYAFTLPAAEAFELVREGKIKTAPALVALQWLQINHAFLRDFWLKKF